MDSYFLYDDVEATKTRFVSFIGSEERCDLALTQSSRFYGKVLVLDLLSNHFALIGPDDLAEPGYLEEAFHCSAAKAHDMRQYLEQVIL